jgi:hypothetical protein
LLKSARCTKLGFKPSGGGGAGAIAASEASGGVRLRSTLTQAPVSLPGARRWRHRALRRARFEHDERSRASTVKSVPAGAVPSMVRDSSTTP